MKSLPSLLLVLAAGSALAQTPGLPALPETSTVTAAPDAPVAPAAPVVPSASAGPTVVIEPKPLSALPTIGVEREALAPVRLPEECGGATLSSDPGKRERMIRTCTADLESRHRMLEAMKKIQEASKAPVAERIETVPAVSLPPVQSQPLSSVLASATVSQSPPLGTGTTPPIPVSEIAPVVTSTDWPELIMGGCNGDVCTGVFRFDGSIEHVTSTPGAKFRGVEFVKFVPHGPIGVAVTLRMGGKTKVLATR